MFGWQSVTDGGAEMATMTSTVLMDGLADATGFRGGVLSESLQGCREDRAEGCPAILSALYASHYRYVLAVCRHYFWRREDAEDAAAEVFLKLHKFLQSGEQPTNFRPWLSTVTGRHCIDKLRRKQCEGRYRVDVKEFGSLPDVSTPSPLSQILRQEEEHHLREELRRLPRHYRVPLVLRYYRRMSYAEIAQTLGKQIPAIKMTIFRAKRELRERLVRLRQPQTA
jgi:RNA polymerase sigma-70 factor, ECF subfamily